MPLVLFEKEKDLEMTAKIGQSLLQRNKQLMMKIETMEDYLSQSTENAAQLQHDLQLKSKLVEFYAQDEECHSICSAGSKGDRSIDDEEIEKLTSRCRKLEKDNQSLFSEALGLKQMTEEMEDKEKVLVMDCIEQLASAKIQITQLTDEIALKFEDNLQQQMEISQLINMVVELQRKQKMLMDENGDLQEQLNESNENRENLQEQLHEMQVKFRETKELMIEHQEELKALKSRLESTDNPVDWLSDSGQSVTLQDSLANEIEETVRRDLTSTFALEKSKVQNRRVMDNVRNLNVRGSDTTSGRTSPASIWSLASDERSESFYDDTNRVRKPTRKLQIVKPMEGSDTLNKWHHLASKNIKGGLDVSSEDKTTPEGIGLNLLDEGNMSMIPPEMSSSQDLSIMNVSGDEFSPPRPDETLTPDLGSTPAPKPKPLPRPRPRVLSDLSTPQKKTIITRNSSALRSVRKGRSLLKSEHKDGRSQAEVIDMIAAAMEKVNVEAKTEQRILSSLNLPPRGEATTPVAADFTSMPKVAKALNKAAQLSEVEREAETELPADTSLLSDLSENSEISDAGGPATPHKSYITSTETVSPLTSPSTVGVESSLHSISGPLGLLNRARPSDPNADIMDNLLRYSAGETSDLSSTLDNIEKKLLHKDKKLERKSPRKDLDNSSVSSSDGSSVPQGSLVDIMATTRRKARPVGLGNLVGLETGGLSIDLPDDGKDELAIDEGEIDLDVDDKTRTTKSDETTDDGDIMNLSGQSDDKKDGNNGLFGFFSSFLS